jgi:hypothetical protein
VHSSVPQSVQLLMLLLGKRSVLMSAQQLEKPWVLLSARLSLLPSAQEKAAVRVLQLAYTISIHFSAH